MNKVNITLITPSNNKIHISTDNIKPTTINAIFDLTNGFGYIKVPEKRLNIELNDQSNWLKVIKLLCNELKKIDWYVDHSEYFIGDNNNGNRDLEFIDRYEQLF